MDQDYYINSLLDSYRQEIKNKKKSIFWNKTYIILCVLNLIVQLYKLIQNFNGWYILFYITVITIWILCIFFTIKTIISQKKNLSDDFQNYYNNLKTLDMPTYLKETRIKKLKKLKKANWI